MDKDIARASGEAGIIDCVDLVAITNTLASLPLTKARLPWYVIRPVFSGLGQRVRLSPFHCFQADVNSLPFLCESSLSLRSFNKVYFSRLDKSLQRQRFTSPWGWKAV